MKTFEEIEVKELKKVCRSLNETGFLENRLIYGKTKKGMDVYTDFIEAVEGLDEEHQRKLPEDVINFYNDSVSDEITAVPESVPEPTFEETAPELEIEEAEEIINEEDPEPEEEDEFNGLKPLDFEGDTVQDLDGSYVEEEEVIHPQDTEPLDVDQLVIEPDIDESPVLVDKPNIEPEKPIKPRTRLSTIPMYLKTENGKINVKFPTLEVDESFELPKQGDREALKAFRKTIFAFAQEKGATVGQKQAISKELNLAGYYMR